MLVSSFEVDLEIGFALHLSNFRFVLPWVNLWLGLRVYGVVDIERDCDSERTRAVL